MSGPAADPDAGVPYVVVPVGVAVTSRSLPPYGDAELEVRTRFQFWRLGPDEITVWEAARSLLSPRWLVDHVAAKVSDPVATLQRLLDLGAVRAVPCYPGNLLEEFHKLRLIPHARTFLSAKGEAVVGSWPLLTAMDEYLYQVYCWSAAMPSLGAAIELVASRASHSGVNDLQVIVAANLAMRTYDSLCEIAGGGAVSFDLAAEPSE